MKQEAYILRIVVDGKEIESARASNREAIETLIHISDTTMREHGYVRVSYYKVRIDKKRITTITLGYSRGQ